MRFVLTLVLVVAVAPAGAETYKWVDEKGRVNYSNNPPPDAGKAKQVRAVEDRISTYQTDPAYEAYLRQRAAQIAARQEEEWLERQRALVVSQASYPTSGSSVYPDSYSGYGYPGYYYPAVVGTRRNQQNQSHFPQQRPRVTHHSGSSRMQVAQGGGWRPSPGGGGAGGRGGRR